MRNLFIFIFILFVAAGCTKSETTNCNDKGTIQYTGPVATDGCDWTVTIDSVEYHPAHLDSQWMNATPTKVELGWHATGDTFICGWGVKMPVIEISCIKANS